VGQLVAESVRFYGAHFWRSLALGLGPAAVTVSAYEVGLHPALTAVIVGYLGLATTSYIGACLLVSRKRPSRQAIRNAFWLGVVILVPGLVLSFGLGLLAVAWLALVGLAVPVALIEELPPREALRRGIALGRTDYVHAFGSLCAITLVVFLTQSLLFSLLHGGSRQAIAVSAFLASAVISPLLFIGGALVYVDQAARAVSSAPRARRRRDADVSHAHNPH
jgi:hypothetical protein